MKKTTKPKIPKNRKLGAPRLSILVPVYNEEKTIHKLLKSVTALPIDNYEVLVVNDASKDKSLEIIESFQAGLKKDNVKLKVFEHPKNRGKGGGIKTGLLHATGQYFVIQDADLEYDPKDIPTLLDKAMSGGYPVVYGSRFKGSIKNMHLANNMANRFYNFILRRLYTTNISDMHTCYKMVNRKLLKSFNMKSEGFDYATELVSNILRRGIEIVEVPISFNGRTKRDGKKIGVRDGIDCTYKIFKYRFGKLQ
jgi:glycosyltransferase involved in cell wall biosynthesis